MALLCWIGRGSRGGATARGTEGKLRAVVESLIRRRCLLRRSLVEAILRVLIRTRLRHCLEAAVVAPAIRSRCSFIQHIGGIANDTGRAYDKRGLLILAESPRPRGTMTGDLALPIIGLWSRRMITGRLDYARIRITSRVAS